MNELLIRASATFEPLSARAARMASTVAEVVERAGSADSGALEAASFLREWAAAVHVLDAPHQQPIDHLADRFGLSSLECDLLVLAGLAQEHEGLASTFRAMNPNGEPWPTAGIAALVLERLVERATVRELLCAGPLIRHHLVRMVGKGPLFEQSLSTADRLWAALHGDDAWPEGLIRVNLGRVPPGLARWTRLPAVRRAALALHSADGRILIVASDDSTTALGRCAALAAEAGVGLVAARMPGTDAAAVSLLAAHAAARNAVPLIVVEPPPEGTPTPLLSVAHVPGPIVICMPTGAAHVGHERPIMTVPIGPVTSDDRRDAWREAIPELDSHAAELAARHPLDPALTAQVALDARALSRLGARHSAMSDISALIRARAGVMLPPGIDLLTPAVSWDRLVLPEEPFGQLRDAVSRLEHQGVVLGEWGMRERARASSGARVLLTGQPGTGKSLAAEALATAASTDLLRVDTSQVVSKWIGETEKNLAAAFDVAERTQAVLFMDEADALFGARTAISDAIDRYANLETAYLLQRLDRFDGMIVLATNLRNNIDAAFVRRMDFVIDLPLPDVANRRRLWELHLPPERLVGDIDLDAVAHLYPIPGAWIRNASIAAAFRAATDRGRIRQQDLVSCVRREYAKAALPFPGEPTRRRNDE